MKLPHYERAFRAAGLAVVAFDHRHFGASGGQPRQLLRVRHRLQDLDAAPAIHYPADHLQVYSPPLVDELDADQVGFPRSHLGD
jgi:alpha-beta hydrolase superfamily lysophospholipase